MPQKRSIPRFIWLLVCLALFIGPMGTVIAMAPQAPATQVSATAVVTTGALNVRSGPGVGYNVIGIVYQGTTVTLVGRNANSTWALIRIGNGTEGWVNASLIQANVALNTLPVVGTPTITATAVVNTGELNLRAGPSVNYGVITTIRQGTQVTPLGRNSNSSWAKVRLANGTEGWVNASLITANVAISSLPVVDANIGGPTPVGTVNTGALNLRSGPGVAYGILSTLQFGQQVTLIGRNANSSWVKVKLSTGHEGWVNASLLNINIVVSTLPVVDSSPPPVVPTAIVNTSSLNMRSGPGVAYGVVTVLGYGQSATLLARLADNSWVQLQLANGTSGWVNARYITANINIGTLPVAGTAPVNATAVVATGALNVRYGPDVSYGAFAIVYQGTAVTLLGRNGAGNWVKIRLTSGAEGWVNAAYLSTSVNIGSLPQLW